MRLTGWLSTLLLICTLAPIGCVERTITVRTNPPGALVTVNGVEKGRSPVTFPFTWYGDYRLRLDLPEYQTRQSNRKVDAPIYQWPVLDFVCEILLPFKFHDHHEWSATLAPRQDVPPEQLIDQAEEFRRHGQTMPD